MRGSVLACPWNEVARVNTLLLAVLIGVGIGWSLGMLGGGGSILTVPALVYLLNQDVHLAAATSLVIVGTNSLMGATMHYRHGNVRLREAVQFGGYGLVAAFVGAKISRHVDDQVLMIAFAMLMLVVAAFMLRRQHSTHAHAVPLAWWKVMLGGVGVGLLTGFLGVGGGFLILPALVVLLGLSMRDAVGSSLVVIAMNCIAGLLGHLSDGALQWGLIGTLIVGGALGILFGTWSARRLPMVRLHQMFAVGVAVLGMVVLVNNIG